MNSKFVICLIIYSFSFFLLKAQTSIVGVWLVADKDAKIEITQKGSYYIGKAIYFKDTKYNNKIGALVLQNFTANGNKFSGGTIQDPRHNHDHIATGDLTLSEDGKKLTIKGTLFFVFTKTEIWTKI